MKELKKYHLRKLAIIEMIEKCEECIYHEEKFIETIDVRRFNELSLPNSQENIYRYERIKQRLEKWLYPSPQNIDVEFIEVKK